MKELGDVWVKVQAEMDRKRFFTAVGEVHAERGGTG